MKRLVISMVIVLMGLIILSLACGKSGSPSSPATPVPTNIPTSTLTMTPGTPTNTSTNTPTSTATQTATATPTATTCSIYGNDDVGSIVLAPLNQYDIITNQVTISSATSVKSFSFYLSGNPNGGTDLAIFSKGSSTASLITGTEWGYLGGVVTTGWVTETYSPAVNLSAGNYFLMLQFNGTSGFSIGTKGSSCTSYDSNYNEGGLFYFNPWDYLNGNGGGYPPATVGSTCYEIYIQTCP